MVACWGSAPPPPFPNSSRGSRGDAAPGGEAGRPLASPRPRLREAETVPRPLRPGEPGVRDSGGLLSLPLSPRGLFPCSPSRLPLGSQRNRRLLVSRQGMAVISAPRWLGPALIGTGENPRELFSSLPPPPPPPAPALLGKLVPPSSGVWGAVLLGPVSVCFTLLFLVPVLTEEKVKRECMIIPRLGKAVFSLVQCKKGSEIQRGYDIIALEGILKGLT